MKNAARLIAMVGAVALVGIVTVPHPGGAEWNKDWHCQLSGGGDYHRITEADIDDWADGTHPYWPGDCSVHETYTPPPE